MMNKYALFAATLVVVGSAMAEATKYCAVDTDQAPCPCTSCHTLDYYLSYLAKNVEPQTTFMLLPGVHDVHKTIIICENTMKFVKYEEDSTVTIGLQLAKMDMQFSVWGMVQASNISFSGIDIFVNGSNYSGCYNFSVFQILNNRSDEYQTLFSNMDINMNGCGGGFKIVGNVSSLLLSFLHIYGGSTIAINLQVLKVYNIVIENSLFENNHVIPTRNSTASALAIVCPDTYNKHRSNIFNDNCVLLKNVTFLNNSYVSAIGSKTTPTLFLYRITNIKLINCSFVGNIGSSIGAESSNILVKGNLLFLNNNAYEGAGMNFDEDTYISINVEAQLSFINNRANHTGGAIYVSEDDTVSFPGMSSCFFQSMNKYTTLIFENNTAFNGGDAIYGGKLDQASTYDEDGIVCCMEAIRKHSTFVDLAPNNLSLFSSYGSRVCFCADNKPLHLNYTTSLDIYPGQTFNISAFIIGQCFGTTPGVVYAQFLNRFTTAQLKRSQYLQHVTQFHCSATQNVLSYTTYTEQNGGNEILVLTTQNVSVSQFPNNELVQLTFEEYNDSFNMYTPTELLRLPMYINITVQRCPPGFRFSTKDRGCGCSQFLKNLNSGLCLECDIQTQLIFRAKTLWITATDGHFVYSKYCFSKYCNTATIAVSLRSERMSDVQCVHNHAGTLCSHCRTGYSLAIGSSRCLKHCSDRFLSLILVFAAAGLLLVLAIKFLNLTVTQGAMNGLIFYANIVQINKGFLLPNDQKGIKILNVFIAWLNLDFGIETCFYNNMDLYAKTWLQFIFPLYIWILAGGIIFVCRYSQRATNFFGNNTVPVLATLFLLSYNKLLQIFTTVIMSASVEFVDFNDDHSCSKVMWAFNAQHEYLGFSHGILMAFSMLVFVFLWLPFTIFLLFGQLLQRWSHPWWLKVIAKCRPFLDAYYGPFKDRHRYWVGILLLARICCLPPAADPFTSASTAMLILTLLNLSLLFFASSVGRVYKMYYLSILENSFFLNLVVFGAVTLYLDDKRKSQAIISYIMIGHALVTFLAIVLFQICLYLRKLWWKLFPKTNDEYEMVTSTAENRFRYDSSS